MTFMRKNITSGVKWESIVGYSRAVRVGPFVYVSGTTGTGANGAIENPNDMYAQAKQALSNIVSALASAGAEPRHVVRTRLFVTDIDRWEEVARAHLEVFDSVRPATAMYEVSRLVSTDMLVEIEADAYVDSAEG